MLTVFASSPSRVVGSVIACRFTMQKTLSYNACCPTQLRIAPR